MSDREFGGGNEDLSLPKATVQKILTEILPPNQPTSVTTSKDFRDALIDCCVEFINLLASEANDISEKEQKKTIAVEHVTQALKVLEFDSFIPPVVASANEYRSKQEMREERQKRFENPAMTQEEMLAAQEEMFRKAREKFNASGTGDASPT